MHQLKQTIQTYIETLYSTGASKDYELAYLMEQVEEKMNTFNEILHNTNQLDTKAIVFYTDWMLSEIEVIKPDTLENSILILINILDKLSTRLINKQSELFTMNY